MSAGDEVPLNMDLTEEQEAQWVESYTVSRFRVLGWYSAIMQLVVSVFILLGNLYFIATGPTLGAQWGLIITLPTLVVSVLGVMGVSRKSATMVMISGVLWAVIAFLLIALLSAGLFFALRSRGTCHDLGCAMGAIFVIYAVPLLFILTTVTCPMLYFHIRHAYDLRSSLRAQFVATLRTANARNVQIA